MFFFQFGLCFFIACQEAHKQTDNDLPRIISLSPHITEIIYALGAQDQLIAVTDFCNYPPAALQKDKIGGLLNPNIEKMITLQPTHLFGLPSHEKLNQQLQRFGYQVIMMPNEEIREVLNSIRLIGSQIDRKEAAEKLIGKINFIIDSLRVPENYQQRIPAVLIIGRTNGSLQNMTVAGDQTYINELWQLTGGENIYRDLPTRYGSVNLESLLLRNPTVIIEFDMKMAPGIKKETLGPEWQILRQTEAVKNGQVYVLGGSHTMIPGPRMVLLAEDFSRIIRQINKPGE